MSKFYDRMNALALRLIAQYGSTATLIKYSGNAADPAKPWLGEGTQTVAETVTDVPVMITPLVKSNTHLGGRVVNNALLEEVKLMILAASPQEGLEEFHMIVLPNGISYKIEFCEALKPADKTLLYYFGANE